MPITGAIPLPQNAMDSFLDTLQKSAQIRQERAKANLPFGGADIKGPAGQVVGLEMVKQLYGENSPQYQQARNAFNMAQQSNQARIDYQNSLSGSTGKRFASPMGKEAQELQDIQNGFLPGTNTPLTEDQKKYYEGKYGSKLLKSTTDADTRKRNLYAKNIDITLNKINPDDLTRYSGIQGIGNLAGEATQSQLGKASENYKNYQKSLTNAKLLAKQVRQFYGDSITPEIQRGLKELTNPNSWLTSPEIAKQNFNSFVDTLRSEARTYQQATESPDVYTNQGEFNPNPSLAPGVKPPQIKNGNKHWIYNPKTQQLEAK